MLGDFWVSWLSLNPTGWWIPNPRCDLCEKTNWFLRWVEMSLVMLGGYIYIFNNLLDVLGMWWSTYVHNLLISCLLTFLAYFLHRNWNWRFGWMLAVVCMISYLLCFFSIAWNALVRAFLFLIFWTQYPLGRHHVEAAIFIGVLLSQEMGISCTSMQPSAAAGSLLRDRYPQNRSAHVTSIILGSNHCSISLAGVKRLCHEWRCGEYDALATGRCGLGDSACWWLKFCTTCVLNVLIVTLWRVGVASNSAWFHPSTVSKSIFWLDDH